MIKLPTEAGIGLPAPAKNKTIEYAHKQLPDR
jgi:hypothetical protein